MEKSVELHYDKNDTGNDEDVKPFTQFTGSPAA